MRRAISHGAVPAVQPPGVQPARPCGVGRCPMCEQPIGQDIARRIEAKQREQYEAALSEGAGRGGGCGRAEGGGSAGGGKAGGRGGRWPQARRLPGEARPGRAGQGRRQRADRGAESGAGGGDREARRRGPGGSAAAEGGPAAGEGCGGAGREEQGAEAAIGPGRHAAQARGQVGATSWAKAPRSICSSSFAAAFEATASNACPRGSTAPT